MSTAPPDTASAAAAVALKDQGNAAFAAKDYASAIRLYSQGIELDPTNYILFSNRSVP
jgi:stress-induced-phosphoprotein 1